MRETFVHLLIFLCEHYLTKNNIDVFSDPMALNQTLVAAGFNETMIDKTLAWLAPLEINQSLDESPAKSTVRIFSPAEKEKLSPLIRYSLVRIDQEMSLSVQTRELIIDRLMAIESEEVALEEFRWTLLFIFCLQGKSQMSIEVRSNLMYLDPLSNYVH